MCIHDENIPKLKCRKCKVNTELLRSLCKIQNDIVQSQSAWMYRQSTIGVLEMPIDKFRMVIEDKFEEGMSWDNFQPEQLSYSDMWFLEFINYYEIESGGDYSRQLMWDNFKPIWAKDYVITPRKDYIDTHSDEYRLKSDIEMTKKNMEKLMCELLESQRHQHINL